MSTTYTIKASVSYEGEHTAFDGTEEECREWLQSPRRSRGYDLDDLEIYANCNLDIYEMAKKEGE